MPKLKPATQAARREHILDAAELCFAEAGFHRTTMHDICKAADVSPGALYVYFASKEALIAGIAERDRAKLARQLSEVAAAPDLMQALARLAEHYAVEEPPHKRTLCLEIGLESTRNPAVGAIYRSVDRFVVESFAALLARAKADGRITSQTPPAALARTMALIGDGMFWRRAIDPDYDAAETLAAVMMLVTALLGPVGAPVTDGIEERAPEAAS